MHLTPTQLQTYFDGEMREPDRERTTAHLHTCPDCQTALRQIETRANRVGALLSHLEPTPASSVPASRAYAQFQKLTQKEPKMSPISSTLQKLFSPKFRPALATGLIIALLALSLTVPSIRAAAIDFLGLFRVQQIEVVEFNPANLPQNFNGVDLALENQFTIEESGDPIEVADAAEATALAGFPVLLPSALTGQTRLTVQPETTASLTVDLALWQGLLDDMGRTDIRIPTELDGQTITFHADKSVTLAAGTCLLEKEAFEQVPYGQRSCTLFVQIPSPTIDAPPTLPIQEIGQAALELLGMSAEEAAEFSASIDWATTLVIPVPTGSNHREVTVQGVTGTIFFNRYDSGRVEYTLIWVKDGLVYSLTGPGSMTDALDLANSLK